MITAKVEKLLADYRPEHSEFQIENFIVGCGHPWGQYKQALRELSARHSAVLESSEQIRELKNEIDKRRRRWLWRNGVNDLEIKLASLKNSRKSKLREYCTFY